MAKYSHMVESSGLVVMGGDSHPRRRRFVSPHWILSHMLL